jgi:flagellar hook assembly protein FlgD
MAGYLGQQVLLNGSDVAVSGGQGGQLQVDLSQDAASLQVQFLDSNGEVVGERAFAAQSAGKRTLQLDGLSLPDGTYWVKVSAVSARGTGQFQPEATVAGIVTGFIPGPDPKLIVGGREVSVSEVKQVTVPPK